MTNSVERNEEILKSIREVKARVSNHTKQSGFIEEPIQKSCEINELGFSFTDKAEENELQRGKGFAKTKVLACEKNPCESSDASLDNQCFPATKS
jgi:hypothetical protein